MSENNLDESPDDWEPVFHQKDNRVYLHIKSKYGYKPLGGLVLPSKHEASELVLNGCPVDLLEDLEYIEQKWGCVWLDFGDIEVANEVMENISEELNKER
jgi:hypothetical protein